MENTDKKILTFLYRNSADAHTPVTYSCEFLADYLEIKIEELEGESEKLIKLGYISKAEIVNKRVQITISQFGRETIQKALM
ncbi:hypothetical protein CJD36_017720 [Flavipsychrobacter stenotrophus]|uniref:ArsR family transcriptional regulator n=1 Tax=Flavipsychrobacter stenotrophus TaxID=2077091 RepID=A0A2S7STC2_9BACT|nr:hypothetical protein [Flavipsychrobacter stenotrophus]PQJ09766.1 hypothetical protein CJD36_017720 [Flavipsychrobacter stenotrophus]